MNVEKPEILIATKNAGKLAEFERILGNEFTVIGLNGFDLTLPDEGTESYRENAEVKARWVAEATGRITLGDDSGIEAAALDGRPGIISARFAGEPVSDQRNITRLLKELAESDSGDRSAQFVCWLSLAGPEGLISSVEGTCTGTVGFEPRGENGFGYDPIFVFPDGRTMAELTDQEKDDISHRGNAIRAMLPTLRAAVAACDDDA
jgi:XTP/dITP diphosphohydrolase